MGRKTGGCPRWTKRRYVAWDCRRYGRHYGRHRGRKKRWIRRWLLRFGSTSTNGKRMCKSMGTFGIVKPTILTKPVQFLALQHSNQAVKLGIRMECSNALDTAEKALGLEGTSAYCRSLGNRHITKVRGECTIHRHGVQDFTCHHPIGCGEFSQWMGGSRSWACTNQTCISRIQKKKTQEQGLYSSKPHENKRRERKTFFFANRDL
mmetsp:Transcript_34369/g.79339  ORF Transcript_34369/g.79339 Transcript_34369/m.79339 type:complete len:206 (+) Transcript_34369:179-796(+)